MSINKKDLDLAFKVKLVRNAFGQAEEFENRIGLSLLRDGLLRDQGMVEENEAAMAVLENQNHPKRLAVISGPLVPYRDPSNESSVLIIEVTELLLNRDIRARRAAFNHYRDVISSINHPQPSRIESALREHESSVLSDDFERWSKSSIILYDLIRDDFFINLAGLHQSLKLGFQEGVRDYFPKILNPSISSVEWIARPVAIPSTQHDVLRATIKKVVSQSNTFLEACNLYFKELGVLALEPSFSLAGVLAEWRAVKGEVENIWKDLWGWADSVNSPVARYQVCYLFCCHPTLVPTEETEIFWDEILDVIDHIKEDAVKSRWEQEWKIRRELAEHYLKYFEIQRPERNSEAIAHFAWWLSEQVAKIFEREWIEKIRSNPIGNYRHNSTLSWQTIVPRVHPSSLRFATTGPNSPWSLALLSKLSEAVDRLKYSDLSLEKKAVIEMAIGASMTACFPLSLSSPTSVTYGFEIGIGATVNALVGKLSVPIEASGFDDLRTKREVLQTNEQILEKLKTILEFDRSVQSILIFALRTQAYLNAISPEDVWNVISDEKWFRSVFSRLDVTLLQFLIDGLNILSLVGGEQWRCNFPHILAITAEATHGDAERQKVLFLYVILACVTGDTVSAIERLKRGENRSDFAEHGKFLTAQFEAIAKSADPWVAARLRPMLVGLAS